MNKLEQIREVIDKALISKGLDSTRALKFGCRVSDKTGENDPHRVIAQVGVCKKHKLYRNCGMYCDFDGGVWCEYSDLDNPCDFVIKEDDIEIIGRDINKEMVEIAIRANVDKNGVSEFTDITGETYDEREIYYERYGLRLLRIWKPTLPLDQQSPETISFIHSLLVKE